MPLKIRRAEPVEKDARIIETVELACFKSPWSFDSIMKELEGDNSRFFIAEDEERLVGSISGWLLPPFECQIGNLGVLPGFRRQGAGRRLLLAMTEEAERSGICDITLEVRSQNKGAIALYESEGFVCEGIRKNYYEGTEDALIMWKRKETKVWKGTDEK